MGYKWTIALISMLCVACMPSNNKTEQDIHSNDVSASLDYSTLLQQREWQIIALNGKHLQSDRFRLYINAQQKFSAYFGCNRIWGKVKLSGVNITIQQIATTRMVCSDHTENVALKVLDDAFSYEVITTKSPIERLNIKDKKGKVRLQAVHYIK